MIKPASFLAGLLLGLALSAGAAVTLTIDLTHHNAIGRTQHAAATLNSARLVGTTLYVDYTSPELSCNGFEP